MQAPNVSIVIPTYARPTELRRAIRTVQRQSIDDWELIIVDDGSPQPVTLEPDVAADDRIVLIRQPSSMGVSHARNTGIAHAGAPWVAFLDDDDLWWPGGLAALSPLRRPLTAATSSSRAGIRSSPGGQSRLGPRPRADRRPHPCAPSGEPGWRAFDGHRAPGPFGLRRRFRYESFCNRRLGPVAKTSRISAPL